MICHSKTRTMCSKSKKRKPFLLYQIKINTALEAFTMEMFDAKDRVRHFSRQFDSAAFCPILQMPQLLFITIF